MGTLFQSSLSSIPFSITGPEGGKFFVHSALIAQHSRVLDRDVNGGMKEASERVIKITDIDHDIDDNTVACFIEYVYTGDYAVPYIPEDESEASSITRSDALPDDNVQEAPTSSPGEGMSVPEPTIDDQPEVGAEPNLSPDPGQFWGSGRKMKERKKKRKSSVVSVWYSETPEDENPPTNPKYSTAEKKEALWEGFVTKAVLVTVLAWEPRVPDGDDYLPDLLCHAQLYVFSSRYECDDLALLALQKLTLHLVEIRAKPRSDANSKTGRIHIQAHT